MAMVKLADRTPGARRWIGLALASEGLLFGALLIGCPGSPDWPPFVRSGPPGGTLVGTSATGIDGGEPDSGTDSGEPEGGAGMNLACTYAPAGATTDVCAILLDVPTDDVATASTNCQTAPGLGGLGGMVVSGNCSAAGLVGCCDLQTGTGGTAFGSPNYLCYYTGTVASQTSACSALSGSATFSKGLPTL
jgi:hypothetical protein